MRDQTDDTGVAGGGVFGEEGAVGSFVGDDELPGHGEGDGVVIMGVENDEAGVFQAGDTFAGGKVGPHERSEASEEWVERGEVRDAGISGGGYEDGEVVLFGQVGRRTTAERVAEGEGISRRGTIAGLGLAPDGFDVAIDALFGGPAGGEAVAAVVVDVCRDAFGGEPFGNGVIVVHGAGIALAENGGAEAGLGWRGGGPAAEMDARAVGGFGEEVSGIAAGFGRVIRTGLAGEFEEQFGVNLKILGEDEDQDKRGKRAENPSAGAKHSSKVPRDEKRPAVGRNGGPRIFKLELEMDRRENGFSSAIAPYINIV